jgi:tricorn protease
MQRDARRERRSPIAECRSPVADSGMIRAASPSRENFMIRRLRLVACLSAFVLGWAVVAAAIDTTDTRLLSQPAISQSSLAFVYAGDLWAAGLDGKNVRRLTTGQGVSNPAFSPDGSLVAFTAQYEGNADVYVVPVAGGVPTRLTWHPGRDVVQGFTPDGRSVVFTSARAVFSGRYTQMFTVPVKGGALLAVEGRF